MDNVVIPPNPEAVVIPPNPGVEVVSNNNNNNINEEEEEGIDEGLNDVPEAPKMVSTELGEAINLLSKEGSI